MLSPGLPDPGVCGPDRRGRCLPRLPGASRPAPAPMPGSHREDPVSLAWESPPSRPPPTLSGSVGLDTPWLTREAAFKEPPSSSNREEPASCFSKITGVGEKQALGGDSAASTSPFSQDLEGSAAAGRPGFLTAPHAPSPAGEREGSGGAAEGVGGTAARDKTGSRSVRLVKTPSRAEVLTRRIV